MAEEVTTSEAVVAKIDRLNATLRFWMEVYRRVRDHVAHITDPGLLKKINVQIQRDLDDLSIDVAIDVSTEPYEPSDLEDLRRELGSAAAELLVYVDNRIHQGESLTMALVENRQLRPYRKEGVGLAHDIPLIPPPLHPFFIYCESF